MLQENGIDIGTKIDAEMVAYWGCTLIPSRNGFSANQRQQLR